MSDLAFIIAELKSDNGQMLTVLSVTPKEFKTGSRGYYANQKMEIGGKRYQIQVQLVEIGSKSKSTSEQQSE
jgi:hypothetical protein